jgi:2'-5' RNA ligase
LAKRPDYDLGTVGESHGANIFVLMLGVMTTSRSPRLFLGLRIPGCLAEPLADFHLSLAGADQGIRWSGASNLHITLKYLGSLCPPSALETALSMTRLRLASIRLCGADVFENAGVVFVDIYKSDSLLSLQHNLEEMTGRLGIPESNFPYRPHITIGQRRGDAALDKSLYEVAANLATFCETLPCRVFDATTVTLFKSSEGEYEAIADYLIGH